MNTNTNLTGKPSVDRPWMKFYPPQVANMEIPQCTLTEYLKNCCPGSDIAAMHYYGADIIWSTIFEKAEAAARSLRALGFGENDQIPVFLSSVPEFIYLLLAAEKIGASLLCRDNTIEENVEAVQKSGAKAIIAHDYLSQSDLEMYLSGSAVEKVVLVDACQSCSRADMPEYIQKSLDSRYSAKNAEGPATMNWDEFLALGESYTGTVEALKDYNRPLFCAYTSGSTGPSKQVIHSAHTMIAVVHQMNFYAGSGQFRPTWMLACLPPALVAVVVSGLLMPLSSNKLLILNPFCAPEDIDLEMMRYRPNSWMMIPMFVAFLVRNGRITDDYDMSYLLAAGVGCEACNNKEMKNYQKFLKDHNCNARFTTGYGCSEAGSNMTLPMMPYAMENGSVGVPLPVDIISIFKAGTHEELGYNQMGEICKYGQGNMLGYDDPESTAKALQMHEDGRVWLHTGDMGYMTEDGVLHVLTRGKSPRHGGGDLATLLMENIVADADIEGIKDEFFVIIPDEKYPGRFLPYLYVILEDGYTVEDIADQVYECLDPYMHPVDIFELPERPFFHFKTNRVGLSQKLIAGRKIRNIKEKMDTRTARG
ncbi:MAG: class I adenylate-forming enzyme family protein [Firmicutes bacterium]|nr:class I adenylate-forming enzyme family protein [Bacillota bacterium]